MYDENVEMWLYDHYHIAVTNQYGIHVSFTFLRSPHCVYSDGCFVQLTAMDCPPCKA